jgi:glc operon protein GlcG
MRWIETAVAALLIVAAANPAHAQVTTKKQLTIEGARQVIAAAAAEARKSGAGGAIAVVDDGGNLVALERLDGTFAAGANISIGKARTAAIFKQPDQVLRADHQERSHRDGGSPRFHAAPGWDPDPA